MKKMKVFAVLTAALTMIMSVTAFAATSPVASSAMLTSTGTPLKVADVDATTASNLMVSAADYVVKTFGATAQATTLMTKEVYAPDGYVQGTPIGMSWNVAGVAAGDVIVIVHYSEYKGATEYILPDSIENGVVKFTLTSFSPVAIVKVSMNAAAAPEAIATATLTQGLKLPKTADMNHYGLYLAVASAAGGVMLAAAKSYRKC